MISNVLYRDHVLRKGCLREGKIWLMFDDRRSLMV